MVSIRFPMLAAVLSLCLAAPATAGWWPSQSGAATENGATASPATAAAPRKARPATGTAVPEPADFALFAAGVIGLLLGRRGSRSRRD